MGVLGVALGLEPPGLLGVIPLPVAAHDKGLGRGQRLLGQAQGVGTHIGDKAHSSLSLDVHPLIELLGDGHGTPGSHVQLAGGFLLEGGSDERRGGIAVLVLPLHGSHPEVRTLYSLCHSVHFRLAAQLHLLPLAVELRLEVPQIGGNPGQVCDEGPVLLGLEGTDLLLPLHHKPGGHRLNPAGGQAPADLLPQQRGELVAHDAVQHPPGLLCVHQVLVDLPGMGDGVLHYLPGDLVEGDPEGLVLGYAQHGLEVPGDGFPFPVRVGGQVDHVAGLGGLPQVLDGLFLCLDILVVRLEGGHVHPKFALGQVPDMAHRRLHLKVRPQVFPDGLGLGRGFHNH